MKRKQNHNSLNNASKEILVGDIMILLIKVNDNEVPPIEGVRNLLATDKDKQFLLWYAELPQDYPYAYYNEVEYLNNKLFAWCGSTMCEINLTTGEIITTSLVK